MFGAFGIFPKTLEIVKFTMLIIEDVHYYVHVIHQSPLGALLRVVRSFLALFPHAFFNKIGNCLDLHMGFSLAKYEKISYGLIYLSQVKRYDIISFFLLYCIKDGLKKFALSGKACW